MNHPIVQKDDEFRISILQFLLLNSFFTINQPVPEINQCIEVAAPFVDDVREFVATNFQNAMGMLTKLGQGWKPRIVNHLHVLYSLVHFADKLMKNKNISCKGFDLSVVAETWSHSLAEVEKLRKNIKANDQQSSESSSFQILYLYLMTQLFVTQNKTIELIEEVEECCKRAMKKGKRKSSKKTKNDETEPEWVDVVVDVLLSMLSQGNKLTRTVVDNVFCLICPYLTEQALKQILDVINSNSEDGPLVEENEDFGKDDSSEGEESEDNEDDTVNSMENEELRSKVFQALGPAVDAGSDQEEEETYLGDEEMFQLDDALADAFRSMKKPKNRKHSKEDESLMNFRLRCIDLLDIMIRVEPKLPLLLKIILPVISALRFGIQHNKFQKALIDKSTSCLNHLCKLRKFTESSVEQSDLLELLSVLLKNACTVTNPQVNHVLTNACMFVILCNRKSETDVDPEMKKKKKKSKQTEAKVPWYIPLIKEAFLDFFDKKNSNLQSSLFQILLTRNRAVGWQLHKIAQDHIFNSDVRLFKRTQGLNIFCQIIRCGEKPLDVSDAEIENVTQIDKPEWQSICKLLEQELLQDFKNSAEPNLKPKHITELLRLLHTVLDVDSRLFQSKTFTKDDNFVEILLRLPVRKLEKDARKFLNRSIHMLSGKPISEFRKNKNRKRERSSSMANGDDSPNKKSKGKSTSNSVD